MLKKYKWTMLITSVITLLPILLGLILWDRLPEQIATHFDANGVADDWSSRGFAVFGLPLILLAVQWLCMLGTAADPKQKNISGKAITLVLWIIPVVSLLCNAAVYAYALEIPFNMATGIGIFIGIVFLVIGNYLPKSRQNYTMGIKIPWTLHDENNWNATHRFAGRLYMVLGLLVIALSICGLLAWMLPILIACVLVPVLYSYVYYVWHKTDA